MRRRSAATPPDADASASERALFDYFDDLFSDGAQEPPLAPEPGSASDAGAGMNADTGSDADAGSECAAPLSEPRQRPAPPALPFAEPVPLPRLRLPLPPLAPQPGIAAVAAPEVAPPPAVPPSEIPAPARKTAPAQKTEPAEPAPPEPAAVEAPPRARPDTPAPVRASEPRSGRAPPPWPDNGRPPWAQQPFECLLFTVGGLGLAVPLVELGSIYPLAAEQLTPIFGQAGWFMGLQSVKESRVRVIDGARVVMPERYEETMRAGYRYVITLAGSDWGLAVDRVVNTIELDPEQVRWRGRRGQRPWLAGTVVAQMCALLDVAQLVWLFDNQDRRRRAQLQE